MFSATYVRNIDAARAFYELLGFQQLLDGKADSSAWSVMQHGELSVLLAYTRPWLDIPPLPLLFYFYFEDLEVVTKRLDEAGVPVTRTGHPPHALGGEVKVLDPDGNTVLLGQRERSASQEPAAEDDTSVRFSLLREAAATVSARGGISAACQVHTFDHLPCPHQAEVKLADSGGDVAWVCLTHADEILMTVPAAFIASQGEHGIAEFLARRQ
jgi:catechol 2,3-dioxygenase-like lactoylglutathione lyase family enzyme